MLVLDLIGIVGDTLKLGKAGARLKSIAGNLTIRNTADTADAEMTASKVNVSGDVLDLNSDSAGAGADWKMTLQRPAAGMTADVALTFPVDDGTPGQVLATDGLGVTSWQSSGSTASHLRTDETAVVFGSTSPVAMFSTGVGDIIESVEVIVDTPFNGTPSLSVGIAGVTSKYMASTDIDLAAAGGTSFQVHPNLIAQGIEALIATYAAGAATAGAARINVNYNTPS